jgi:hypothetical protein
MASILFLPGPLESEGEAVDNKPSNKPRTVAASPLPASRARTGLPKMRSPLLLAVLVFLGGATHCCAKVQRGDNFVVPAAAGGCSGVAEFLGCFKE